MLHLNLEFHWHQHAPFSTCSILQMQFTFSFKLNLNRLIRFNSFHFSENKIEAPILHYKNNLLALHDEFLSINEMRLKP